MEVQGTCSHDLAKTLAAKGYDGVFIAPVNGRDAIVSARAWQPMNPTTDPGYDLTAKSVESQGDLAVAGTVVADDETAALVQQATWPRWPR